MLGKSGGCSFNYILLVAGPLCQGNWQLHGTPVPGSWISWKSDSRGHEALLALSPLIQLAGAALCCLYLINISHNLRTEDETWTAKFLIDLGELRLAGGTLGSSGLVYNLICGHLDNQNLITAKCIFYKEDCQQMLYIFQGSFLLKWWMYGYYFLYLKTVKYLSEIVKAVRESHHFNCTVSVLLAGNVQRVTIQLCK